MKWMTEEDRELAGLIGELAHCNPFLQKRIEFEQAILGAGHVTLKSVWSLESADPHADQPNLAAIGELAHALAGRLREGLVAGAKPTRGELVLYQELVLYVLYHDHRHVLRGIIDAYKRGGKCPGLDQTYRGFAESHRHYFGVRDLTWPEHYEVSHYFAVCFQVRRAFVHIYKSIVGASLPAARLRAAVWQSIFSHNMRRYHRSLYDRMGDLTTLITGGTGTGKELVASAIGKSRFIPYDIRKNQFAESFASSFDPVNLSALSPLLVESELFGHCRGSFTGALADHAGYLESCSPLGTVFLDEIGELDFGIQVKLLRVLQARSFKRVGDVAELEFRGKIIAATNRDLAKEVAEGRFRADFFYRICADHIRTPSLREQLVDSPKELAIMIAFIARRVAGEREAAQLTEEVLAWIETGLPPDYAWPGNFRELEQCVRNVLIRQAYHPTIPADDSDPYAAWLAAARAGTLTADEVLGRYCTLVYAQTQNYQETARRLQLDRRTVQKHIDTDLLAKLGN